MYTCYFTRPSESVCVTPGAGAAPRAVGEQMLIQTGGGARSLSPDAATAEAADFDFLHGQWLVENRQSAEPPWAATGWAAFDSVCDCRPLTGAAGHLEETASEERDAGAVLRLFDARARRWTVYRVSSADGALQAPLRGGFEDGVGTFTGEGTWGGRRVLVRETWTRAAERPRWEQAFSLDGGETWWTHWIRDFIRVDWPL